MCDSRVGTEELFLNSVSPAVRSGLIPLVRTDTHGPKTFIKPGASLVIADTHNEFQYDTVFGNTEAKNLTQTLYAVLENEYGGLIFHGCFGRFEDAVKVANEKGGTDIFKCDLNGNWRQLEARVKIFTIKESLEDPNYNRQTGGSRMLPAKILAKVEGIENAKRWIKEYVSTFFINEHDRVSWPKAENHDGRVRADIHTSRIQNPGTPNEHLLGGFYIGLVHTDPSIWEYVDCENVTTTNR